MSGEEWRVVPSYPWLEASSLGRIRRCENSIDGRRYAGKIIPGWRNPLGYTLLTVQYGKIRKTMVGRHTLVCEAFHGKRPSKRHQAAHYDGNPRNDTPENLRWATPRENAFDRSRHGSQSRERHPNAKFLLVDIDLIKRLRAIGYRGCDIALMFDVNSSIINRVLSGEAWRDSTVAAASNASLSFSA